MTWNGKPMGLRLTGLCVAAVLALGAMWTAPAAAAAKPDANKIFQDMLKQSLKLKDYSFRFDHTEIDPKTKKEKITVADFWWKEPDFRKLAVIDGQHKGSIVVYNPDKSKTKVFGKQGGVEIPGGMPKNTAMVAPFFKVGWQNDLIELKKLTRGGKFALGGEEKIKDRAAWKITVTGAQDAFDKIIIWVDKKDSVLLKHEYYKQGKLDNRSIIYNIKINTGLKPAEFKP